MLGVLPTGGGKTEVAIELIDNIRRARARADRGRAQDPVRAVAGPAAASRRHATSVCCRGSNTRSRRCADSRRDGADHPHARRAGGRGAGRDR